MLIHEFQEKPPSNFKESLTFKELTIDHTNNSQMETVDANLRARCQVRLTGSKNSECKSV